MIQLTRSKTQMEDPNLYSEIDVSYCTALTKVIELNTTFPEKGYKIYPNPFSDEIVC